MAEDCIFCSIVAGEVGAEVVDEDPRTLAFMDQSPWTRGHALLVPRRHSRNLYEVAEDDLSAVALAARRLALQMKERLRCDGVNLLNACEPAAWQTVWHFHLHVIPRYRGDALTVPARPGHAAPEELAAAARELRA